MFTSRTYASLAACATLAALGLAPAAQAQSLTLNNGDAVTVSGAGTVGTINTPTNSYNSNGTGGSTAVQTNGTAAFTLGTGGSLSASGNNSAGLYATGSGPVTITGGTLKSTGQGGFGLKATGSGPITISGGTFTAGTNGYGLTSFGSIDLYGMFAGYATGNTTLPSDGDFGARGTFMGTLQNNTASQLFTYQNFATITLHNTAPAAAPEPSQFAAFAVGLLGLGALALRARKRHAA